MPKRPTKPERQESTARGRARRDTILAAARTVFAKLGYHRSTVEHIVDEAGVARGTYYLYFEDKRAVLAELVERFAERISAAIAPIETQNPERPIAEQVRANIRAILQACLDEQDMTKILLSETQGVDPELDRRLRAFHDGAIERLTQALREGQALGIVANGEPRVLAFMSIGAITELLYQVVTLGLDRGSVDALTPQVYAMLCHGYLRVNGAPKR